MGVVGVNSQIIISRRVQTEANRASEFQDACLAADVVPVCGCYLETLNDIVEHVASPSLPPSPARSPSLALTPFVNREAGNTASLFSIIIADRP